MYEDTNARAKEFACWVGIDFAIAKVLTSRIPKGIVIRISAAGNEHKIDGDTLIFSSLDSISDLKGSLSEISETRQQLEKQYALISNYKKSFERYALEEYITNYLPREITVEQLTDEEVSAIFKWLEG